MNELTLTLESPLGPEFNSLGGEPEVGVLNVAFLGQLNILLELDYICKVKHL